MEMKGAAGAFQSHTKTEIQSQLDKEQLTSDNIDVTTLQLQACAKPLQLGFKHACCAKLIQAFLEKNPEMAEDLAM